MLNEIDTADSNKTTIRNLYKNDRFICQVIKTITHTTSVENIFLLGIAIDSQKTACIFQSREKSANTTECISAYFLLIMISQVVEKEQCRWQEQIESRCRLIVPVTTIVLPSLQFKQWLSEHHPFAVFVCSNATIIYGNDNIELPDDAKVPITCNFQNRSTDFRKAKEFLAGSELFELRKEFGMAAFMLHQSVEQILHTTIHRATGYYANTHHIGRLLSYAKFISPKILEVIPTSREENKRLLQLLQKAYVDGRYNSEYKINYRDLFEIKKWVVKLLELSKS